MDEEELIFQEAYEKLKTAEILFENERYNDSVSTSYYAMFYAAKFLIAKKNIYPKSHKGVLSQFSLECVKNDNFDSKIAELFFKSQEDRRNADYDVLINFNENNAKKSLENAELFINEMERFRVQENR
ncbi:MAG: HEPN domain-containing protein [Methanobacteriaceae archaeon]